MKRLRNSFLLLICLYLAVQHVAARTFRAALPAIRSASFYRVALPPHISAIAGADLRSLRLYNAQGQEQPYLIETFSTAKARLLSLPDDHVPVPVAGFYQIDSSDKRSYLRIRFDESYPLDRLRLRFDGPRYYSRIVSMPDAIPGWQRRIHQRQELQVESVLRGKAFIVVVANDDNPPLELQAVQAEQVAQYVSAWLEPGTYRLEYNDTGTTAPRYDIVVLADSLRKLQLPLIHPATPELLNGSASLRLPREEKPEQIASASPHAKTTLIWCIIGVIVVALVFATRALVRRIGSEGDEV